MPVCIVLPLSNSLFDDLSWTYSKKSKLKVPTSAGGTGLDEATRKRLGEQLGDRTGEMDSEDENDSAKSVLNEGDQTVDSSGAADARAPANGR